MATVRDLDPVEHHHRQAHVLQPAAHQLAQRRAGPLDEQLRDRALRRRARLLLHLLTDRLAHAGIPARGHAGEHPVHHRPRQRVPISEVLIGGDRQLALVVGRADPGTADVHAPGAQGHRPALVTVTLRGPTRVVLALRAHDLVDLGLHQLVHDAEPDADAQREQPLPRRADQLTERLLNCRRQRTLQRLRGGDVLRARYLLHGGFLLSSRTWFGRPERSQPERTGQEDRHSNFYENSDNLDLPV
jgi:hypothetical protein